MNRFVRTFLAALATLSLTWTAVARAQYHQPELGSLEDSIAPYKEGEVGVDEKLGAIVPPATNFVDEEGKTVAIGDYFNKGRPIILWIGYYECPMLCDKMSAGMVSAVKSLHLDAGKEFAIVNVSIDPNESAGLAKAKKATYLHELGQPGNAAAWNLLTGAPPSIAALANAVGYKFKKVEIKGDVQYAHPAVLIVLSSEGKVTRYLYPLPAAGVTFDPRTMQLSLIEASEGRVGSVVDRLILTCLHFDAHAGRYTWVAVSLMRWAAGLTVAIMAAILLPLWIRAARRKPSEADSCANGQPVAL